MLDVLANGQFRTDKDIQKHMSKTRSRTTKDETAVCAYLIWEQEGKPVGRALDHWLQAELQLATSLWHESLCTRTGEQPPLRAEHAPAEQ